MDKIEKKGNSMLRIFQLPYYGIEGYNRYRRKVVRRIKICDGILSGYGSQRSKVYHFSKSGISLDDY